MSIELTISGGMGRVAEWHDSILEDGRRKGGLPKNCDRALQHLNEHWYGDILTTDGEKFDEIFQPTVDAFNAKQKKPGRRMGPTCSIPSRQKTYYEGIVDGTWCNGTGDKKEKPVYEAVYQIGNKDDNGTTDKDFDIKTWYALKRSGDESKASEYALAHLNQSETQERTKRILRRAADRLINMDPEHLIVLRVDYHNDEPCGTPGIHIAYTFRGTGYKTGMTERCASVTALKQMGFEKTRETEYGIKQFSEYCKNVIEEEMAADAEEYGYEPIKRKVLNAESREHSEPEAFRELAAQWEAMEKIDAELDARKVVLDAREEEVDDKFEKLTKKQEADAKEFQRREDSLDAQKEALERRSARVAAQEEVLEILNDTTREKGLKALAKEKELADAESALKEREKAVAEKEAAFTGRTEALDKREADIAKREEAIATQEEAMQTRQKVLEAEYQERFAETNPAQTTAFMLGVISRKSTDAQQRLQAEMLKDFVSAHKQGMNNLYTNELKAVQKRRLQDKMADIPDYQGPKPNGPEYK